MLEDGSHAIYPNLSLLYRLLLTLPVTSAACERSFSALKFIKSRLRTVMTQERLRDLMIIAVESERSGNLSFSEALTHFWNMPTTERR